MSTLNIRVDDQPVILKLGDSTELAKDFADAATAQADRAEAEADTATAERLLVEGNLNLEDKDPSLVPLFIDEADNVALWLDGGKLDAVGLGPTLAELIGGIGSNPTITDGSTVRRYRGAVASLRGPTPLVQLHHLMAGDSWTERWIIPQAFHDAYETAGFTPVATGFIGVRSQNDAQQIGTADLPGDAVLTVTGGTLSDASEGPVTGEHGPDGHRLTFEAAGTAAGFTLTWRGRRLVIYHTDNGAKFTHDTNAGGAVNVTLGSGGAPSKTVIDAGSEGLHTTVLTRPDATVAMEWFGGFAESDLAGFIVSKIGNGNSRMEEIAGILGTTAAFILADIVPAKAQGSVTRRTVNRLMWLTNDAREPDSVTTVQTSLATIVDALRTADANAEVVFAIPPDNDSTNGNPIGDYVGAIYAQAEAQGFEVIDYYNLWPEYEDSDAWDGALHLSIGGGWAQGMAAQEFASFGGLYT